ncbi:hypothetical protein H5410_021685 [Solanum commersonii]|uniref:Uncharacterized protein n=1 Tax=Solanum commersonii TaxID=4109 RepID=A0A9J5ZFZ5_SOLCO|nr:hypothetical protein H5410_021685 [Solanum commersonii]
MTLGGIGLGLKKEGYRQAQSSQSRIKAQAHNLTKKSGSSYPGNIDIRSFRIREHSMNLKPI